MTSLEKKIIEQYHRRGDTDALYNSEYARRAEIEKYAAMRAMISPRLRPGSSVLEIGAGQGTNVPMLEYCGFSKIYLNELLPDRVKMATEKYPDIKMYAGNALDIQFREKYDCVFQSTVFTSILSEDDRKELASRMWDLVKPGGFILWYDFIYNNPSNRDVRKVSPSEVKQLFPQSVHSVIKKITLAPPVGRAVGKLYSLFNVPALRSHILAVFQKA